MRSQLRYSEAIGLTLPALAFVGVYAFGLVLGGDAGKTVFVAVLLAAMAGVLALRAVDLADLAADRTLAQLSIALAPFAGICLLVDQPAKEIAYLALILCLLAFGTRVRLRGFYFVALAGGLFLAAGVHLLAYPAFGFPAIYQSFFAQKNVFALNVLMMFFASFLAAQFAGTKDARILALVTCAVCVLLVVLSHSRGVLLDLIFFAAVLFAWPAIARRRWFYWAAFVVVMAGVVAFVPLYVLFSYTDVGQALNAVVRDYTGVNLFSGRNVIWPAYLYFISLKPLLGYGFGNSLGNSMVLMGLPDEFVGLSAHNLYLMVATETGIVGLCAMLFFFGRVWALLYGNRHTRLGTIAAAIFLTGLFNELFEVTLMQTNLDVVAFFWFMVALGLRDDADWISRRSA